MDGKTMLYSVQQLLQESSTSAFLDTRITYDYLYEAACEIASNLRITTASQDITTVATTSLYDLEPDFLCLYMKNESNEYVCKYYDGSGYYWPTFRETSLLYQDNETTDASIPTHFSVTDKQASPTNITGTATADGAAVGGECSLTDATAPFASVFPGDIVHNTTDGSDGIVVSQTSSSVLVTALFNGTADDWTSADAYVIVPQPKKQIFVSPPSETAAHTLTLYYIQKPEPVYSYYRSYRMPAYLAPAMAKYAAWLYKYRDREANYGDAWYKYYDAQMRKGQSNENRLPSRTRWGVNLTKRSYGNRSMR